MQEESARGATQPLPDNDPLPNLDHTDVETETNFVDSAPPPVETPMTAQVDTSSIDRYIRHTEIPEFAEFIREEYRENGLYEQPTIIIAARKAILKGAQGVSKFSRAVANLGKKLWPLLAPIFSIISQNTNMGS